MDGMDLAMSMVLALFSFGCLVYMLVRLAQEKGALHALLGFFFPIYPYFWGWLNAGRLGIVDVMGFWTAIIAIYTGYSLAMMAVAARSIQLVP